MSDLDERLRGIDRLPVADLWEEAQRRADGVVAPPGSVASGGRRIAIVAAALAVGIAAVAWVVVSIRPSTAPAPPAARPILSPAPRDDCPIGLGLMRGPLIGASDLVRLSEGHLPTWMPEGFGLLAAFGPERAADGFAAHAVWSDATCRQVVLTFWVGRNPMREDPRVSVGPWVVQDDDADGCGNAILGESRCLRYTTTTSDGSLTLATMGLDREPADRIALSIIPDEDGEGTVAPAATVAVPRLEGRTLAEAEELLRSSGLEAAPLFFASDEVPAGRVTGTEPEPGTSVQVSTAVVMHLSAGPDGGGYVWAGSQASRYPRVVIGSYRGPDSHPVLAIGPDADLASWRDRLEASADGRPFDLVQCPVGPETLQGVADELSSLFDAGTFHRGAGFGVDARTCSVRVEGSFTVPEISLLRDRFGELVTVVDGIEPPTTLVPQEWG